MVKLEDFAVGEIRKMISKYNKQGEPIIKKIKMYNLPYLKDKIDSLIMWLKDNPQC